MRLRTRESAGARGLRRRALLASSALLPSVILSAKPSSLVTQTYVFTQEFDRRKIPIGDGIEEMFRTVREAGFDAIELMPGFLAPELRDKTLATAKRFGVQVPIVYTGGAMHAPDLVPRSINNATTLAKFADAAINMNPDPIGRPKSDRELATQAEALNTLGQALKSMGRKLLVHHHTPEMADGAREWRSILELTDPAYVALCVDTHWAYRSGQDWLTIVETARARLASLHIRNSIDGVWAESFGEGDLDYRQLAAYLRKGWLNPYLVVELAYEEKTRRTRSLTENLSVSRAYAERLFA